MCVALNQSKHHYIRYSLLVHRYDKDAVRECEKSLNKIDGTWKDKWNKLDSWEGLGSILDLQTMSKLRNMEEMSC